MRRRLAVVLGLSVLVLLPAGPASAHPLGNFTVNTADRLVVTQDGIDVTHVVDLAEIPTVQLGQARAGVDADRDGRLSPAELTAYADRECSRTAGLLDLLVDGRAADLRLVDAAAESRPGTAGLPTTRLTCSYETPVRPRSSVSFEDTAAAERNGWREVTADSECGPLRSSSVEQTSPSALLTSYPADLLQSPLDVTTARFGVRAGAGCTGAAAAGSVDGGEIAPRGVDRLTRTLTDFLGRPDLTLPFALVSVVAALVFGVLHALAPGHGKTVMAAYLVGQRGTRRQALQLGAIVTFTHTASVLLLGAVLALGALAAPELVVPFTEVLSGVLLVAVGVYLLVLAARRWRSHSQVEHDHEHEHEGHEHDAHGTHRGHGHGHGGHTHDHARHDHSHGSATKDHDRHDHPHGHPGHDHDHGDPDHHHDHPHGDSRHDHDHPHGDSRHDHDHPHGDSRHEHPHRDPAHDHDGLEWGLHPVGSHDRPNDDAAGPPVLVPGRTSSPDGGVALATRPLTHSHGGRTHTHAPLPDGPLSWKSLAAMGVAGGLVPSPSALLVLLSATALGRAWFGVVLVVVYGLGMAVTLTAAGLLLLRAQAALDRRGWTVGRGRSLTRLLPLATAGVVVLVGLGLVVRGLATGRGLL